VPSKFCPLACCWTTLHYSAKVFTLPLPFLLLRISFKTDIFVRVERTCHLISRISLEILLNYSFRVVAREKCGGAGYHICNGIPHELEIGSILVADCGREELTKRSLLNHSLARPRDQVSVGWVITFWPHDAVVRRVQTFSLYTQMKLASIWKATMLANFCGKRLACCSCLFNRWNICR